jgi:hypothetical protein
MNGMTLSLNRGCLYILLLLIIISSASCQEDRNNSNNTDLLVLNIYIDNTGRSLINGYVDDISKLAFMNSSEYRYEDNSKQLYAITDAPTFKSNNNWSLSFEAKGSYDEYNTIFYLPADTRLKQIACSPGLEYFIYAANESIIEDVEGYDVISPATEIEYRSVKGCFAGGTIEPSSNRRSTKYEAYWYIGNPGGCLPSGDMPSGDMPSGDMPSGGSCPIC